MHQKHALLCKYVLLLVRFPKLKARVIELLPLNELWANENIFLTRLMTKEWTIIKLKATSVNTKYYWCRRQGEDDEKKEKKTRLD